MTFKAAALRLPLLFTTVASVTLPTLVCTTLLTARPESAQAQAKPATWGEVIRNIFGRQKRLGGSKPISAVCPLTPISYLNPDKPGFNPRYQVTAVANLKPTIAWYGKVGGVKIRDNKSKQEWTKLTPKSIDGLNKIQSETILRPDREYTVEYLSRFDSKTPIIRHKFKTLPQDEINLINQELKKIAENPTTPDSITFEQVLYLSGQDLLNDANDLILTASNPSPELKQALDAYATACDDKKPPEPAAKPSPSPTPSPR